MSQIILYSTSQYQYQVQKNSSQPTYWIQNSSTVFCVCVLIIFFKDVLNVRNNVIILFQLQHNSLEEISDEIATESHLVYLNLSYNKLTTLTSGIYKLNKLKDLLVQHNLLKSLQEDIGDLSSLVTLVNFSIDYIFWESFKLNTL